MWSRFYCALQYKQHKIFCEMIDLLFRVFSILSVNFSLEFKSSELVVSIRSLAQLTTEQKEWKSKRLAIEVPYNAVLRIRIQAIS